jgi:hypothetical protein
MPDVRQPSFDHSIFDFRGAHRQRKHLQRGSRRISRLCFILWLHSAFLRLPLIRPDAALLKTQNRHSSGLSSGLFFAQAVAFMEMCIGNDPVKAGMARKFRTMTTWGLNGLASAARELRLGAIPRIVLRRVGEFSEDREAGAGAPYGDAATNRPIDGPLNRSATPEIHVVRLVSARNEDCRCAVDGA